MNKLEAVLRLVLDDIGWRGLMYMNPAILEKIAELLPDIKTQFVYSGGVSVPRLKVDEARQALGLPSMRDITLYNEDEE